MVLERNFPSAMRLFFACSFLFSWTAHRIRHPYYTAERIKIARLQHLIKFFVGCPGAKERLPVQVLRFLFQNFSFLVCDNAAGHILIDPAEAPV